MRYQALATDYDGTLALHGHVDEPSLEGLRRLKKSGRRVILVTGRELEDLKKVFDEFELFDLIVAENGALLYTPSTKELRPLGLAPPPELVQELVARKVEPISVGHVIVATWEPHETTALETIRDLGLELQVIFNKGAVMILPSGINKAFGLAEALKELQLSRHNVVAVGDAENDHAMLQYCGCSVAVENALPSVKDSADLVTEKDHGAGVVELIDRLLEDDLRDLAGPRLRNRLTVGTDLAGEAQTLEAGSETILICGPSGSGKSQQTFTFIEQFGELEQQFLVIDPEGDYTELPGAAVIGGANRAPLAPEVLELLENPEQSVAVNLLGIKLDDRPAFSDELLSQLTDLRSKLGRPHWIIVDEAHHVMPKVWKRAEELLASLSRMILITVHPESVSRRVLEKVTTILVVGDEPVERLTAFAEVVGRRLPTIPDELPTEKGFLLLWRLQEEQAIVVKSRPYKQERKRHSRKYAEGQLGPDRSFYFRGPHGKLDLRCHNLILFLQIGEGVDEETWRYHQQRHDYSRWMTEAIKDPDLAQAVHAIEEDSDRSLDEAREAVRAEVEERYTLPAD